MTNEEAIDVLKNDIEICTFQQQQACDMAIKALEKQPCECTEHPCLGKLCEYYKQPCEDCISRAEALKHSHIEYDDDGEGHRVIYVEDIENLSSVTPSYNSIKTELDCVSRQAVIQIIENKLNPCTDMFKCLEMSEIKEDVEHLPSVTTKARWIPVIEELPKIGKYVLVYINPVIENRHPIIISSREKGKEKYWTDGTILAWMPLPQPYRAESEEV